MGRLRPTFLLALFLSLIPSHASANVRQVFKGNVLSTSTAGSDKTGSEITAYEATSISFQCVWSGIGGTIDGKIQVMGSDDDGAHYKEKSGASLTLAGSSGNELISLNGVAVEGKYELVYTHNSVSSGTVNCYAVLKG